MIVMITRIAPVAICTDRLVHAVALEKSKTLRWSGSLSLFWGQSIRRRRIAHAFVVIQKHSRKGRAANYGGIENQLPVT